MLTMDSISKAALSLKQPQRADLVVLIMDSLSPPAWGTLKYLPKQSAVMLKSSRVKSAR